MTTPYSISVDWLQVCTLTSISAPIPCEGKTSNGNYTFSYVDLEYQSAMFKRLTQVRHRGFDFATIESSPRSSKLNPRICLIKINNRFLYQPKYIEMLYALMEQLHVTYKGITRIDLCYDCIEFKNGRKPSKFINDYVLKPDNMRGGYSRMGSDLFSVCGNKASGQYSKISYISFGSAKSKVRAYIYDKSLELKEVKDKPWIRKTWEENGLYPTEKNHVFRSEISIKGEGTTILNMRNGDLFRLSPEYLENQETIEELFHAYAYKYLRFKQCQGQKYKKDYVEVDLFVKGKAVTMKPTYINKCADTGRSERICYNKLVKLSSTYVDLAEYKREAIRETLLFLDLLSSEKQWVAKTKKTERYFDELRSHQFLAVHEFALRDSIRDAFNAKEAYLRDLAYLEYMEQRPATVSDRINTPPIGGSIPLPLPLE